MVVSAVPSGLVGSRKSFHNSWLCSRAASPLKARWPSSAPSLSSRSSATLWKGRLDSSLLTAEVVGLSHQPSGRHALIPECPTCGFEQGAQVASPKPQDNQGVITKTRGSGYRGDINNAAHYWSVTVFLW